MSSISAVRFVNIRYNGGQNRILDETYRADGRHTLLELENAGGKTVMTQLLIGLFVGRRFRNLGRGEKARPFSGLFVPGAPSFVLVEWKLDDGAGYLLTGMMARKAGSRDDDGNALEMLNFIGECGHDQCGYGICALPVAERRDGAYEFKGWQDCRDMLAAFRDQSRNKFFLYDMNGQSAAAYYAKLGEYGIRSSEWESVIREVNSDEGALTELFKGRMNERGLLEKWVLKLVETRLSQGGGAIAKLQEAFADYAVQYGRKQSFCDKKAALELYRENFGSIEAGARRVLDAGAALAGAELALAGAAFGIRELLPKIEAEKDRLRKEAERLGAELADLGHSEFSVKFHLAQRQAARLAGEIDGESAEQERVRTQIADCARAAAVQDCRVLRRGLDEKRALLAEAQSDLAVRKNESETTKAGFMARRELLRGQVKGALEAEQARLDGLGAAQKAACRAIEEQMAARDRALKQAGEELLQLQAKRGELRGACQAYAEKEKRYAARRGGEVFPGVLPSPCSYPPSLFERRHAVLEAAAREAAEKADAAAKRRDALEAAKAAAALEARERELDLKKALQRDAAAGLQEAERKTAVLREAAAPLGIAGDGVYDAERIAEKLELLCAERDAEADAAGARLLELQIRERRCRDRNLTDLDQETEAFVRELGIRLVYGSRKLIEMQAPASEKREMLRRHPLLPYALAASPDEMAKAAAVEEWPSPRPVVFIAESLLDRGATASAADGSAGLLIRAAAGSVCLDEASAEARLGEVREAIAEAEGERARLRAAAGKLRLQARGVRAAAISKEEHARLKAEAASRAADADAAAALKSAAFRDVTERLTQAERLVSEQAVLEKQAADAERELEAFAALEEEHRQFLARKKLMQELEADIAGRRREVGALQERIAALRGQLDAARGELARLDGEAAEGRKRLSALHDAVCAPVPEGFRIADAEAEIRSLERKLDGAAFADVQFLVKLVQNYGREVADMEKKLQDLMKAEGLDAGDILGAPADGEAVQALRQRRDRLEERRDEIGLRLRKLENAKGGAESEARSLAQAMVKSGYAGPKSAALLDAEELWTFGFEEAKSRLQAELGRARDDAGRLARHDISLKESLKACQRAGVAELPGACGVKLPACFAFSTLNGAEAAEDVDGRVKSRDACARALEEEKGRFYDAAAAACGDPRYGAIAAIPCGLLKRAESAAKSGDFLAGFSAFAGRMPDMRAMLDNHVFALGERLRDIAEKEEELASGIFDYLEKIHGQLQALGSGSTIEANGRSVRALNLAVPDWGLHAAVYRQKIRSQVLRQFREACLRDVCSGGGGLREIDENAVRAAAAKCVTACGIFDGVVGVENVRVFVLKADRFDSRPVRLGEAAKASGGQHYLASFIMLCAFLNYMHRSDGDSLRPSRSESKVLLLDNPFGKLSSAHLVAPLREAAEKYGVQLVCFTAHREKDIDDAFDNHYLIRLHRSEGAEYACVKGERLKGEPVRELESVHVETGIVERRLLDLI